MGLTDWQGINQEAGVMGGLALDKGLDGVAVEASDIRTRLVEQLWRTGNRTLEEELKADDIGETGNNGSEPSNVG